MEKIPSGSRVGAAIPNATSYSYRLPSGSKSVAEVITALRGTRCPRCTGRLVRSYDTVGCMACGYDAMWEVEKQGAEEYRELQENSQLPSWW